jgi:hypothetical protein
VHLSDSLVGTSDRAEETLNDSWKDPSLVRRVDDLDASELTYGNIDFHFHAGYERKTFVNCYSASEFVVEALVDKLLGKSPFKGKSPVDPFCGYWDARL